MKAQNIKKYYAKKYAQQKRLEVTCPSQKAYNNRCTDCRTGKPPYSYQDFKVHLENQFGNTYSWDTYGEWQVDHIKPLASGGLDELSNIQPLWKTENQTKSKKVREAN